MPLFNSRDAVFNVVSAAIFIPGLISVLAGFSVNAEEFIPNTNITGQWAIEKGSNAIYTGASLYLLPKFLRALGFTK